MSSYYRSCCHCGKEYFGTPGARRYLEDHRTHHLNGFAWEHEVLATQEILTAYGLSPGLLDPHRASA